MTDANGNHGTMRLKTGLAEMLKGGVIMDVVNPEHQKEYSLQILLYIFHYRSDLGDLERFQERSDNRAIYFFSFVFRTICGYPFF